MWETVRVDCNQHHCKRSKLIVASFLGIFLPRESFSSIISKGDMPAQKYSQGLPLKFQDGTGAIKIFGNFWVWLANLLFSVGGLVIFAKLMEALVSCYNKLGKKMPNTTQLLRGKKTTQLLNWPFARVFGPRNQNKMVSSKKNRGQLK